MAATLSNTERVQVDTTVVSSWRRQRGRVLRLSIMLGNYFDVICLGTALMMPSSLQSLLLLTTQGSITNYCRTKWRTNMINRWWSFIFYLLLLKTGTKLWIDNSSADEGATRRMNGDGKCRYNRRGYLIKFSLHRFELTYHKICFDPCFIKDMCYRS